eukprot:sb/3476890/
MLIYDFTRRCLAPPTRSEPPYRPDSSYNDNFSTMSSESVPNFFANDGSFLDQFRKKIANQNNPTEHEPSSAVPVSSCQKKVAPFRPKTACKRINMKASLKKQLKTDLADKGED